MQVERSDFGLQSSGVGWYTGNTDVQNLRVYAKALELLPDTYVLAQQLPRSESRLRAQLCNAARSISAQIAEGFAKKDSQAEFKRFLLIALGSSDEVVTHLRQIKILRFSVD